MAVTLVNGSSLTYAIASAEVGINIEEYKQEVEPQFIANLPANTGITRCDAYGPSELTLTISGETNGAGAGSCMLSVIGVAFTPVNSRTTLWGAPTTGLYWQRGSITGNRSGFEKLDGVTYKAKAGIP